MLGGRIHAVKPHFGKRKLKGDRKVVYMLKKMIVFDMDDTICPHTSGIKILKEARAHKVSDMAGIRMLQENKAGNFVCIASFADAQTAEYFNQLKGYKKDKNEEYYVGGEELVRIIIKRLQEELIENVSLLNEYALEESDLKRLDDIHVTAWNPLQGHPVTQEKYPENKKQHIIELMQKVGIERFTGLAKEVNRIFLFDDCAIGAVKLYNNPREYPHDIFHAGVSPILKSLLEEPAFFHQIPVPRFTSGLESKNREFWLKEYPDRRSK